MREKLLPWIPAIFCASLSLITLAANTVGELFTQTTNAGMLVFLCFLPMCFVYVGAILKDLRDQNRELRTKLNDMLKDREAISAERTIQS